MGIDAVAPSVEGEENLTVSEPDLSIIIVSWNVRELLKACLQSIYDTVQGVCFEVFVVDNASRDGSPQMVERCFPDVRLIANQENLGFGLANNQALREASGRYALLLNPDTTVPPGVIAGMIDFMERHPRAGMVGPELVLGDGRLQTNWVRFSSLRNMIEFLCERAIFLVSGRTCILSQKPRRVPVLTGACWLVRYEAMADIGFYSEDFFMYAEEPDVCTRMRDAGWETWFLREFVVTHYKKQSVRQRPPFWDIPLFIRSMATWLVKRWRKKWQARVIVQG
jgi:GT2 family glycosyltransferase